MDWLVVSAHLEAYTHKQECIRMCRFKVAVTIHWTTGLDFLPFLDKFVCIFSVNLEALFKNYCYKATVIYAYRLIKMTLITTVKYIINVHICML